MKYRFQALRVGLHCLVAVEASGSRGQKRVRRVRRVRSREGGSDTCAIQQVDSLAHGDTECRAEMNVRSIGRE